MVFEIEEGKQQLKIMELRNNVILAKTKFVQWNTPPLSEHLDYTQHFKEICSLA